MMWITITKLIGLAALCLLLQTRGAGAEIFQWTDAKGTLHFTDNPHRIPEAMRNSPALIIRKDLEVESPPPETVPLPLPAAAPVSASVLSDGETHQTGTEANYAVEEVNEINNIIVVFGNSQSRRGRAHSCRFGGNCRPVFRANFADRQYIHPSVFDGGSRQYIHPGSQSLPKPVRKFSRGRR
jgi:hypothetical protein